LVLSVFTTFPGMVTDRGCKHGIEFRYLVSVAFRQVHLTFQAFFA
jgi:hypothetical protein